MHSAQEQLILRYFHNSPWAKDIADGYVQRLVRSIGLLDVFFGFP